METTSPSRRDASFTFALVALVAALAFGNTACSKDTGGGSGGSVVQPQPTIVRVAIRSAPAFVTAGESAQLSVVGTTSGGAEQALSDGVSWSTSDAGVLAVSTTGSVTGGRAGRARISVTYNGLVASVDLVVPSVAAQPRTVRVVYLAPQDREFRDEYDRNIIAAFVNLQDWYRDQMGGPVFTLRGLQADRCRMTRNADYYLDNSFSRVLTDAQRCLPVRAADTTTTWVLYADVGHGCNLPGRLGVGQLGLTIMGQEDLQGLNDEPRINDGCQDVPKLTLGRWRGGAGHEVGHAFGLPHPPGCDAGAPDCDRNALMWQGYAAYPAAYLRDDEKARLRNSPFFAGLQAPPDQVWDLNGRP